MAVGRRIRLNHSERGCVARTATTGAERVDRCEKMRTRLRTATAAANPRRPTEGRRKPIRIGQRTAPRLQEKLRNVTAAAVLREGSWVGRKLIAGLAKP